MRSTDAAAPASAAAPTVWIFEDQLSPKLSALVAASNAAGRPARVLLIESKKAFAAWPFHRRRLGFLVSAMRHFVEELRSLGHEVDYFGLDRSPYLDSLSAIRDHIARTGSTTFFITRPSEHHTQVWLDTLPELLGIEICYFDNNLFLTDRADFADWFGRQRKPVMEMFYRRHRIALGVLMDDDHPAGGKWNLDKANRKPAKSVPRPLPAPLSFTPDAITRAALADVERYFTDHPGSIEGFDLPVTRVDAQRAMDDFLANRLPRFGDWEDAMLGDEPTMFHSVQSVLMNAGLLEPLAVVRAAEQEFREGRSPLNCVEGFVRQIIGWREYVYGIYHTLMPDYRERNARDSQQPLPDWFWTGDVEMNCLHHAIGGVVERGYAHHIQRLMVICNFATLAGIRPQEVNDWFYAMFIDSHDWVVTPNVVGMGMNSDAPPGEDEGVIGTKPYVSSAAYINKMSDYCGGCQYDPSKRVGEDACPFNYLFWTFLKHFGPRYADNLRMRMMLKNVDRIEASEMRAMMLERKKFVNVMVKGRAYQPLRSQI